MRSTAQILVHPTQFPDAIRGELLESLRTRKINHKFLYESHKQTHLWLELHQAFSPSRTDPDCGATYDRAFAETPAHISTHGVYLVGLGCGGGQKDTRLLRLLAQAGKTVAYSPSDVSSSMVLTAMQASQAVVPDERCFPLVCDLATADDLQPVLESIQSRLPGSPAQRLITFFGMIPNFEPQAILPRLAGLLRKNDLLLMSANLSPGPDYSAGTNQILPLYDNAPTRDWLLAFLLDLGFEQEDGRLRIGIESPAGAGGLLRIVAKFRFLRPRKLTVHGETFVLAPGEDLRLFFSYRYTPTLVRSALQPYGMEVISEWITGSGEEGLFLVRRK